MEVTWIGMIRMNDNTTMLLLMLAQIFIELIVDVNGKHCNI